jgi:hypothetical protein
MNSKQILIQLNKVKIKIVTDYSNFLDYLKLHFNKVILSSVGLDCDIESYVSWKMDFWGKNPPRLQNGGSYERLGGNLASKEGQAIWINKRIKKRRTKFVFQLKDQKLLVRILCHKKLLRDTINYRIIKKPEELFFFELTFYVVYYPLFWYLESFRNIYPLHSSAVKINDSAILIAGLEGTGKTTLALSLLDFPKTYLIADNLILYDTKMVYPCYGPIMLHYWQDNSLWMGKLRKINEFKTLKNFYEPLTNVMEGGIRPAAIFLPRLMERFLLEKLSKEECINILTNTNNLSGEIGNYNEFRAVLNLLTLHSSQAEERYRELNGLLEGIEYYKLGVLKHSNMKEIAEKIYSILKM